MLGDHVRGPASHGAVSSRHSATGQPTPRGECVRRRRRHERARRDRLRQRLQRDLGGWNADHAHRHPAPGVSLRRLARGVQWGGAQLRLDARRRRASGGGVRARRSRERSAAPARPDRRHGWQRRARGQRPGGHRGLRVGWRRQADRWWAERRPDRRDRRGPHRWRQRAGCAPRGLGRRRSCRECRRGHARRRNRPRPTGRRQWRGQGSFPVRLPKLSPAVRASTPSW